MPSERDRGAWDELVAGFVRDRLEARPHQAVLDGLHEFDGRLPDWSRTGLRSERDALRRAAERARAFDPERLDHDRRVERLHLLGVAEGEIYRTGPARWPERNPLFYAGALSPSVYIDRPYAPAPKRMRALTEHARNVPEAAAQIRENLRPPLPGPCVDLARTVFGGTAEQLRGGARRAFEDVGDDAVRGELDDALAGAADALESLSAWLDEAPEAPLREGLLGEGGLAELLAAAEGIEAGPGRLASLARDDLERNRRGLHEACARWNGSAEDVASSVRAVRRAGATSTPVEEARRHVRRLRRGLREQELVTVPDGKGARVEEAPAHLRWNPAMIDIPGPCEEDVPAVFYVRPPQDGEPEAERHTPSSGELLFMSAHEVWPGHYLHFLHAHASRSPLARHCVGYGVAEGWAHYAEELCREAGLAGREPAQEVAYRLAALVRDVRCLAALGLHAGSMDLEGAETLFREEAHLSPGDARRQAARSVFDPECVGYTLGKIAIRKLREDCTGEGGEGVRDFHDRLLELGGPPLAVARAALTGDDDPASLF